MHPYLCRNCGQREVIGKFSLGDGDGWCSQSCYDGDSIINGNGNAQADGDSENYLAQYDDDPNPYSGTYSEE